MNTKISALITLDIVLVATGLRCWNCDNAASEDECIQNGQTQRCGTHQRMSCQTEIRFHEGWGGGPKIRTGCKEYRACHNNQGQNSRSASKSSQCNSKQRNSVCRCCCQGLMCNRRNLLCKQRNFRHIFKIIASTRLPLRDDERMTTSKSFPREIRPPPTDSSPLRITFFVERPAVPTTGPKVCRTISKLWHGKTRCDSEQMDVGTACIFSCNKGYKLNGNAVMKCILERGKTMWNLQKPVCEHRRKSVPLNKPELEAVNSSTIPHQCIALDIVVIMDSSHSITMSQWKATKNFVADLIKFSAVSHHQYAVYRFNRFVDVKHQILFADRVRSNIENLSKKIKSMPKRGFGTRLGRALKHAKDVALSYNNRVGAPDVILVISGSATKDMPHLRKVSAQLRLDRVQIIAIGVAAHANERQLVAMTGNLDNVFMITDFENGVSKDLLSNISKSMCNIIPND